MEIDEIISTITILRKDLQEKDQSTNDLLRFISQFQLNWGQGDDNVSDNYNLGATKPVLLSGLALNSHKLKTSTSIFENSEIAKTLTDAFAKQRKITPVFLTLIHGLIMKNGGEWREVEVTSSEHTKYISPPFSKVGMIEAEINDLTNWFNIEYENAILHPLVICSIFHHRLLLIHPFIDGNGRLARILSSMILLNEQLPPPILLPNDRGTYLSCLRNADSGDTIPLMIFIGEKVINSLNHMISLKKRRND